MISARKIFAVISLLMIAGLLVGGGGCKSKKKAMEAAAAKAKQEQEATLRKQQEEEALRKREAEERARREEEAARERERARASSSTPSTRLEQYFTAIASAPSVTSANSSIQEALSLFASENTPVLIVISEEGGQKDYDKPTTIKAYLNYLKDQKKNINRVADLQLDASGKIKEVELRKQ